MPAIRPSTEREKGLAPANFDPKKPLAGQVLAHAQSGREVVQEFVPLAQSLEWGLGQEYLRERGNKAFISDAFPVPFVIKNHGTLARIKKPK